MADLSVTDGIAGVRARIAAAGGDPERVRIVAVTKGLGVDAVAAAVAVGLTDIGENYANELLDKAAQFRSVHLQSELSGLEVHRTIRFHFLGAVQRNKVAKLAPYVACWQGVDRVAAGEEIARRSPGARVFVQVNVAGHVGRNGCTWDDAPQLVHSLRAFDLDVAGLMAVGSPDHGAAEKEYARLAELRADLDLAELSIGMSDDIELAVAAGSTMVRVGRSLFGARPLP